MNKNIDCDFLKALILILVMLYSLINCRESQIQIEAKGAYTVVDPHVYIDSSGKKGFYFNADVYSSTFFSENLSLIINQYLRAYGFDSVLPQRQIPIENSVYSGLRFSNSRNIFQAGIANYLYFQGKTLFIPDLPEGTGSEPAMLNGVDASWDLETDIIQISTAGNYFVNSFTIVSDELYCDPYSIGNPSFGKANDADLWLEGAAGFSFFENITAQGCFQLKEDLNKSNSYDLVDYQFGFNGEHEGDGKRMFFSWDFYEHFFKCDAFTAGRTFPSFFSVCAAKMLFKIKPKLIFKGIVNSEFSSNMLKVQYEAALKKQWGNGNDFSVIYYGTSGVLFPRKIMTIQSDLKIYSHFGLSPKLMIAYGKVGTKNVLRYYRSEYGIELYFPIVKRFEAFCDYSFSHFEKHPLFSSRNTVSAGIRTW